MVSFTFHIRIIFSLKIESSHQLFAFCQLGTSPRHYQSTVIEEQQIWLRELVDGGKTKYFALGFVASPFDAVRTSAQSLVRILIVGVKAPDKCDTCEKISY